LNDTLSAMTIALVRYSSLYSRDECSFGMSYFSWNLFRQMDECAGSIRFAIAEDTEVKLARSVSLTINVAISWISWENKVSASLHWQVVNDNTNFRW
jgi:hypothetical protein